MGVQVLLVGLKGVQTVVEELLVISLLLYLIHFAVLNNKLGGLLYINKR